MSSTTMLASFQFLSLLSLCILLLRLRLDDGVAVALLPKGCSETISPYCGRRKLLAKTLSGLLTTTTGAATIGTFSIAGINPAIAKDDEGNAHRQLLSLESAAAQLNNHNHNNNNADADAVFANRWLLNYPHPGLRRKASPVTSFDSDDLETVVDALVACMDSNASTPIQYGIDARIIVLKGVAPPNGNSYNYGRTTATASTIRSSASATSVPITVFCNPTILARSSEDKMVQWREYEYCLVVEGNNNNNNNTQEQTATPSSEKQQQQQQQQSRWLEVDLLRDDTVEVAAQDLAGKPIRMALNGEASRAFQHELDHLNGILIVDHANPEDLPIGIAVLEKPFHDARQKKALERTTYQGNTPLYF